ncbi:GNAT family N-acetyltransferase [Pyxidicoccus fallax]|uniref:GNAT family N-acetyltransferase n=1 Tax=Pyxidicoccus fallax TaxID=394095 RepID=A0A848LLD8_9BACT|nr:GNAT family N-acetyltransferase [Pyxidicoccus fallax]NMO18568.1 GNAT family N-acetyltransferase [Pyxidicoccus fallax]NPC83067.1 GNAT family N-acetyltransferase [Pyxidicoccus fallax]
MSQEKTAPSFQVRPASEADAPVLLALLREFATHEESLQSMSATEPRLREALGARPPLLRAALVEGPEGAVGFATYTVDFMTWANSRVIRLDDLYVRASVRGAGLGRALMRHLAEVGTAEGMPVRWEMRPDNASARAFYTRIGALAREKTVFRWMPDAMRRFLAETEPLA